MERPRRARARAAASRSIRASSLAAPDREGGIAAGISGSGRRRHRSRRRACARRGGSADSPCSGRDCRRRCPRSPARSASGFCWRKAWAFITKPGVQKPHCVPLFAAMQCWTGSSPSWTLPIPSIGRDHHAVDRAERPQAGVDGAVHRVARRRVALREHDGAGAAAPLAAAHLGPGQADAVQVVRQQDRRVRVVDDDLLAVEPEDEAAGVRCGARREPGRGA